MKLNKSHDSLDAEEKAEKLKKIKGDFYDGLMNDLLNVKSYQLAQVIYSEKLRENFGVTIADQMIGLEIFASQRKMTEYREIFDELSDEKKEMDQHTAEELVRTLTYFESDDKFRGQMLEMVEIVQNTINDQRIHLSSKLLDDLMTVYTESQQWAKINSLLQNLTPENCSPQQRLIGYLKKNIIYCFDAQVRGQLKDNVDLFEQRFFSAEARRRNREMQAKREETVISDFGAGSKQKVTLEM